MTSEYQFNYCEQDLEFISFEEELILNYGHYLKKTVSYLIKKNYHYLDIVLRNKELDKNDTDPPKEENQEEDSKDSETFLM